MPTYAYACTECGHRFDAVQSFTDDALTTCPECEGRLRKVFNSVGVVFKGSGFYRTDSRSDGTKKSGTSSSGESSSASSSSQSSSASSSSSTTSSPSSSAAKSGSGASSAASSSTSSS